MSTIDPRDFYFEGGDVKILVSDGEKVIEGLVYSQILCLVSEVWKRFIYPPFLPLGSLGLESGPPKVANPDTNYYARDNSIIQRDIIATLDFKEDDPEALSILLKLAHHQAKRIPEGSLLDYPIFPIANLVEQYQLHELVKRFIPKWIDQPVARNGHKLSTFYQGQLSHEERMFVAYVFGIETEYVAICSKLVEMLDLVDGKFLSGCKSYPALNKQWPDLDPEVLPGGVLERMKEAHGLGFATLLKGISDALEQLQSPTHIACEKGDKNCDNLLHSSLILGLTDRSLWPLDESREQNGCLLLVRGEKTSW
ncbi:hypothetical protein HYFRA_00003653 [Hymenoscyphus fraxineus]|uniref:Uncharacterized protein n=1 Tax=Hymenoscyphus fraxineus TaxID=746836 RepID=A0A9N9PV40_9HELO|nr:hypothetical protein HYFRA_00003653 [Hymenoscyphus fraxineus]